MTSHDADDLARIPFQKTAAATARRIGDELVVQLVDHLALARR